MNRKELQQHYFELQRKFEANKTKRAIKTILAFAVAIFGIWCFADRPTGLEIVGTAFASIFMAGIHFWINSIIFSQLVNVSKAENNILEGIRKKLQEYKN